MRQLSLPHAFQDINKHRCFVYVEGLIVYYSPMNDYLAQALLFWCWDGNFMKKFPCYENVLEGMSCSILAQRVLTGYGHGSSCELSQGLWKPAVCFSVPWFECLASWYLVISQKVSNPILVAIMFFFVLHVSRSIDSWCQIVVGQNFLSHTWSITAELF
jgi:hypothetical protein